MTFWAIIKDKDEANNTRHFCKFEDYRSKREVQETAKARCEACLHT